MRIVAIGLLVAAGVALSLPAKAQGVYVEPGPGGVGVGVDTGNDRPRYDEPYRERSRRTYIDETNGYGGGDCRVKIIRHADGRVTRIRRCD
jgi:hypothetical protein